MYIFRNTTETSGTFPHGRRFIFRLEDFGDLAYKSAGLKMYSGRFIMGGATFLAVESHGGISVPFHGGILTSLLVSRFFS